MKLTKRIIALLLSLTILVTPTISVAEDDWAIPAGEVTTTAIADDYLGGEQIDIGVRFGLAETLDYAMLGALLGMDEQTAETKLGAIVALLEQCTLEMSFYDDFGTARVIADLMLDETPVLSVHALVFEDGSMQMMTNLTGKMVLTLPAGTFVAPEPIDVFSLMYGDFGVEVDDSVPFEQLPAFDRLRICTTDAIVMIFGSLLGWVSGTQMETGELYIFDDTYLDATETRDAVAQRMVGKITTFDFVRLLWNIVTTLRDDWGLLQQAMADCLAEVGVTRYQVRQVVDGWFPDEHMDPAEDWVQPSHAIADDGALCTLDDISYFFKKMRKSVETMLYETTDADMSLIVSYDDYGGMVGFDATVPHITPKWPFEGDFTYSIKTDENWQRLHTSHGELQVYGNNRVIGDLDMLFGEDVGGVNENHFNGVMDVVNQDTGNSFGFGVHSGLDFVAEMDESGYQNETFSGSAALSLRENGAEAAAIGASIEGETQLGENGFSGTADAVLDLGLAQLTCGITFGRGAFDDVAFGGGEAINLSELDEATLEKVKDEIISNAAGLAIKLALKPSVLSNLMKLTQDAE